MYIFILFKNALQLIFGYLFTSATDIKFYKIYNIEESIYPIEFVIILMLLYECLIYGFIYFGIFLILYFFVLTYGNKLFIHIIYLIVMYCLIVFGVDEFNIFFLLIMIISGILNWWLFKKWMN
ncbi:hypothetical protein CLU96_2747 [Chryseobacterium sp. 52]|nr:hypothetical protein CLU96_2747 [Chryseobacterium sp. 52]